MFSMFAEIFDIVRQIDFKVDYRFVGELELDLE